MEEIQRIPELKRFEPGYRGIIFDLDDTLYNEIDYIRSGYHAVAEEYPDKEGLAELLWEAYTKGQKAFDTVFPAVGLEQDDIMKAVRIYRDHFPSLTLSSEVYEYVVSLRKTHRIGIITDGRPEGQRQKIQALGLDRIFSWDDIIITDELGGISFRKPDPAAYIKLQERWGLPFREMLYVGDNPAKDFIAPQQLGMGAVRIMNKEGVYWNRS